MIDPITAAGKSEKELMDILMKIERALSGTNNGPLIEMLMKEKEFITGELEERRYIEAFKMSNTPTAQNLTDDELSRAEEAEEKAKREAGIKKKKI